MSSQSCHVQYVGNSRTPVLRLMTSTKIVLKLPITPSIKLISPMPRVMCLSGLQGALPQDLTLDMLRAVLPDIYRHYAVPRDLRINVISAFSELYRTPLTRWMPPQSRPHYDHALPRSFAVLHYVNPGQFGGTGFFRHVPSGFELITSDNQKTITVLLMGFCQEQGLPQGYDMTQQDHYTLLDAVDYAPNRLLIYPSGLLHSGLIKVPADLNPDPSQGRLTSSIFINFYAPDADAP